MKDISENLALNDINKELKEIVVSDNEEVYNGISKLKDGWKRVKLGEICELIFSGGTPDTRKSEFWNGNFGWLSSGETRNRYINKTEKKITQLGIEKSSTRLSYKGDVLIASAGQGFTRGQTSFNNIETYINQSIIGLRGDEKKIDKKFLFFNLSGRYEELRQLSDGNSIRGSLTGKIIRDLEINLPPLEDQKKIASILSSLDDKIELNNEMNKTLEEMAQTLFKQRFIDFEFPNEKGEPYKSSGGKMVESELGEIPEGWIVRKLGEELSCILGGTPSRSKPEYWNGNINWINSGKINEYRICKATEYITKLGFEKSATKILPKHTVVLAITGATLGQISLLLINSCANQSVIGIVENEKYSYIYIYEYIKNIMKDLVSHQTGGAQQHINKNNVENIKLLSPKIEILNEYTNKTEYIYEQIENNCFKNIVLKDIRDTLLHKLMNGEVEL